MEMRGELYAPTALPKKLISCIYVIEDVRLQSICEA
jgi:hypothetical protein